MAKTINSNSVRGLINKANTTVVIVTSIAAFVTIFSLVATKTFISQAKYQNHVLKAQHDAVSKLKGDIKTSADLSKSFSAFVNQPQNVIGGNSSGTSGLRDGDNAKIILDALPSNYDFPALATTLEGIVSNIPGLTINNITGTDDEVAQIANQTSSSPQPIAMPFQLSVAGNYDAIKQLINNFEHSVRPFQIQTVSISGDQDNLTMDLTAQTFYQPAKSMKMTTKDVK